MRQARDWVTCIIIILQLGLLPDWQCLIACDRLKSAVTQADHERCSCAIARQVLCLSVGLDHASCLESVSISSHSVALNKATDVGRFTEWVWLK